MFNIGGRRFLKSSVLKSINAGKFEDIEYNFKLWRKVNGVDRQGLINRRKEEYELYLNGDYNKDF